MIDKFSNPNGAKYFSLGIIENYFVFVPAKKFYQYFTGTTRNESWKFNGKSEECIGKITKSDNNFAPIFFNHYLIPDILMDTV